MSRAILAAVVVTAVAAVGEQEAVTVQTLKVLPRPGLKGAVSVEEALARRRSVRSYSLHVLTDEQVSQLLWAAQGISEPDHGLRTAPSAGATYPLETYLAVADGLFRYLPQEHALERVRKEDVRKALAHAALNQSWVEAAPAVIVFTAVLERTTRRYGQRGIMYIHMEAGHAAQNVHLQAVALGLGSVPIGAFSDEEVAKILGLAAGERPLYMVPVGR